MFVKTGKDVKVMKFRNIYQPKDNFDDDIIIEEDTEPTEDIDIYFPDTEEAELEEQIKYEPRLIIKVIK